MATSNYRFQGIDADNVRQQEQKQMLEDVKKALSSVRGKSGENQPIAVDTRTGATALHVAAAKVSCSSLLGGSSRADLGYDQSDEFLLES